MKRETRESRWRIHGCWNRIYRRGNGDYWSGTVVTPLGYVEVWISSNKVHPYTDYSAIVDGSEHRFIEQGISRTPTGAARVAHKWIKSLQEKP